MYYFFFSGIHYIEEVERYIESLKLQVEAEKKEITESENKFSNLVASFSEKVINNLYFTLHVLYKRLTVMLPLSIFENDGNCCQCWLSIVGLHSKSSMFHTIFDRMRKCIIHDLLQSLYKITTITFMY